MTGPASGRPRRPAGATAKRVVAAGTSRLQGPVGSSRRRVRGMMLAALFLFTVFGAQLVRLQGFDAAAVSKKALQQRLVVISNVPAPRGRILAANGAVLAESVDRYQINADQVAIASYTKRVDGALTKVGAAGAATDLAAALGLRESDVLAKITGSKRWNPVAVDVTPVAWQRVSTMGIPGISADQTSRRVYPLGTAAASVVGTMTNAGAPAGGIEQMLNTALQGKPGTTEYERAPSGRIIATAAQKIVPPVPGKDVTTTIDPDLQWFTQNALAKAVAERRAANGYVIVQDVQTGKLLTVANYPTFDPNNLTTLSRGGTLSNKAFEESFEPGSTAKVLTMAAVLADGKATPSTPITVPPKLPRSDRVFKDSEEHGWENLTLTGVLAKSSNMGTILAGEKLSSSELVGWFHKFGLGSTTGIGYPGESAGQVTEAGKMSGSQRYTVMFGQGLAVTAPQVAGVYQTIANGGLRIAPTLVNDGSAPATSQVMPTQAATTLSTMMESVVSEEGTAAVAMIPGYRVAGKTGTANRIDPKTGKYSSYTASFVGFAPADKPRFVVACMMQDPKNGHYGSTTCGPVFASVMRYALEKYGVPPTNQAAPQLPVWQPGYSKEHPSGPAPAADATSATAGATPTTPGDATPSTPSGSAVPSTGGASPSATSG